MPEVTRALVDVHTGQNAVMVGRQSVKVNGYPISTYGDICIPHTPYGKHTGAHCIAESGEKFKVYAEGSPVSALGDAVSCGDTFVTGSPNVNVGNPNNN